MKDRRTNCAEFHVGIKQGIEMIKSHDAWINGNGKPGAKETISSMATLQKIELSLLCILLAAVAGLFFKG